MHSHSEPSSLKPVPLSPTLGAWQIMCLSAVATEMLGGCHSLHRLGLKILITQVLEKGRGAWESVFGDRRTTRLPL